MLNFFVALQTMLADRLERDDKGASLVEYGLLVGLIAVIVIGAVTTLGQTIAGYFANINTQLN